MLDEDDKRIEEEKEELRKRRLRTELQVAKIAKENPEMLDNKSKEILNRLDNQLIKRNNQLDSIDMDKSKLKRSYTKKEDFLNAMHSLKENSGPSSQIHTNAVSLNAFKNVQSGRETPRLFGEDITESYKPSNGTLLIDNNLNTIEKSDRSNISKADSLNRARIIHNADELQDDGFEDYKKQYLTEQIQKAKAKNRNDELEDLLHELNEGSEKEELGSQIESQKGTNNPTDYNTKNIINDGNLSLNANSSTNMTKSKPQAEQSASKFSKSLFII